MRYSDELQRLWWKWLHLDLDLLTILYVSYPRRSGPVGNWYHLRPIYLSLILKTMCCWRKCIKNWHQMCAIILLQSTNFWHSWVTWEHQHRVVTMLHMYAKTTVGWSSTIARWHCLVTHPKTWVIFTSSSVCPHKYIELKTHHWKMRFWKLFENFEKHLNTCTKKDECKIGSSFWEYDLDVPGHWSLWVHKTVTR